MMYLFRAIIMMIVVVMVIGISMQAYSYEFMTEAAFTKRAGYDPIPIKKGEKVLAFNGDKVEAIVFLIMAPYEEVVKELREIKGTVLFKAR